ncbi:MAG: NADH-quinone oxidoreductase subunit C [Longimicrobiales bacterium]|nr:NADH-quinone oxidoreductase subunit C [Longimicrobiales bacterium]
MADETRSGLDAVEAGPAGSEDGLAPDAASGLPVPEHPTVSALRARFGDAVLRHEVGARDQHVVFIEPSRNVEVLGWLKEDPAQDYAFLSDVTAVDYGGGRPLQVVYQLFSLTHHRTLRVKCELPVTALEVDSLAPLWKTADWLEREVYDLFGIRFRGHPDLRRILMPENYAEGHPLRKDFPLRGRFSRAEQTRRALAQEVENFYIPLEMDLGREPQLPAARESGSDPADQA